MSMLITVKFGTWEQTKSWCLWQKFTKIIQAICHFGAKVWAEFEILMD